jgi:diguanylate cyclase (GGDEF)-like protein/PAS domain S-box-containing protein
VSPPGSGLARLAGSRRLRALLLLGPALLAPALRHLARLTVQRDTAALCRALVESSPDILIVLNPDSTVHYVSPAVERTLGYGPGDLTGTGFFERVERESYTTPPGAPGTSSRVLPIRHADGSFRYFEAVAAPLPGGSRAYYLRDVTGRRSFEEDLARQASHDPLTGLANRTLFMERLGQALSRTRRGARLVAVLFIDLDDFKAINDTLGHAVGDQVLVTAARRLRGRMRTMNTIARLGGDEFTILIEDVAAPEGAVRVAERVLEAFRSPITLGERTLHLTASVGVAAGEPGRHRPGDLMRAADAAMYRAKAAGKAGYRVYEGDPGAARTGCPQDTGPNPPGRKATARSDPL